MKRTILGLALGAFCLLLPGRVLAQDGLYIGAQLNGSMMSMEDSDEDDTGFGITGTLGYAFGAVSPYARLSVASMDSDSEDDYTLGHLDLGARITIPVGELLPYVNGAYSFQRISAESEAMDVTFSGTGYTVGGGIILFFGSLGLDASLNLTKGTLDEATFGDRDQEIDWDNTVTRLDVGLIYYTGGTGR